MHYVKEDFLVDQYPCHHSVIVEWKYAFNDLNEHPECLLISEPTLDQHCCNEVHALTIPDGGVTPSVTVEDASQSVKCFVLCEQRVLGEGSREVKIDLTLTGVGKLHVLVLHHLEQCVIIVLVRQHGRLGSGGSEPQLTSMFGGKQSLFDKAGQHRSLTLIQGFNFSWIENSRDSVEMALQQAMVFVSSCGSQDGALDSFSTRLLENRSMQVTLVDLLDMDQIEISADRTRLLFFIFWITFFNLW